MPNYRDIIEHINNSETVNIYFTEKKSKGENTNFEVYKTEISNDIATAIKGFYIDSIKNLTNFINHEYDLELSPEQKTLWHLEKDNIPHLSEILASLDNSIALTLASEIYQDGSYNRIWSYIVVMETLSGNKLVFFTKYSKSKVIDRSTMFGMSFNGGRFDMIHNDLFTLAKDFHCFYWRDYLYFKNRHWFELIFDYDTELINQAVVFAEDIGNNFISNCNDFRDDCLRDKNKLKKMSNVLNKNYYDQINFEDIFNIKEKYNLDIELDQENEKIVYDGDKQKLWLILKVFDDDYLLSETTKNRYEVHSKKEQG
ncbi:uncharacterized protein DUF4868 [Halanaerobium saccharolyticum]|uniref:Uncharacterized protein DUF4868 n=1 Tax=Halanaerobium saccharolyticum TaxID=43595 RepID=A0A4R6M174_9FIRM|nr:Kiwa anti-phage protein KwaB-like domain-containing protein [Halanaerobium saccharolyticum]TDO94100.1 uncharacterized protein DUF4868 [Halanaerobium saccharolyticum]